jgi:hypothetical protein
MNYPLQIYVLHNEIESKAEMTNSYNFVSFARIVLGRKYHWFILPQGRRKKGKAFFVKVIPNVWSFLHSVL